MFPTLDAIALYCMLCLHRPALYVEIGAGHSTRFARRAIRDNALPTSILPYDYPPDWGHLYYNEQYLLASYLLGGNRLEILLPNAFITRDVQLHKILEPIWTAPTMAGVATYGGSLWAKVRGQ